MELRNLDDCRFEIMHGDLLLFRRRGVISLLGRGIHSHAGKAAWWEDELMCLEVREFYGGRAVSLESQVRKYPRRIDVFRADADNRWPQFDRNGSVRFMRKITGCPYAYLSVSFLALLRIPIVRFWVRPEFSSEKEDGKTNALFCSQACSMADRIGGGVDPIPELSDRFSEPSDLARSPFYQYRFTLE